jgi:hypothetical protein
MTSHTTSKMESQFTDAQRQECDCWEALTKHTTGCSACLAARRIHDVNGFGCDAGLALRDQWLSAARRRYELSPQFISMKDRYADKKQQGAEACK